MKKLASILLLIMLLSVGFAKSGERVYVRLQPGGVKAHVLVYEKGSVQNLEIECMVCSAKANESAFKSFAEILEKYFNDGYKLINSLNAGAYSEYVLEKQ